MADIKAPALVPNRLKLAEHERNVHCVSIPPGVPLASVMRPDYWVNCVDQIKPFSKIECRAQDNAWYAELLALNVGAYEITMGVIVYTDFKAQAAPAVDGGASVSFAPKHGWRVIRDGVVVHKDCATKEEAQAWMAANVT